MSEFGTHSALHQHSGITRRAVLDLLAAALITFAAPFATGAIAQENPDTLKPAAAATQGRMEAPIGHRQPRAQDLPHDVQPTEGRKTEGQTDLDRKLESICRGC
jgi:hypothetical protein